MGIRLKFNIAMLLISVLCIASAAFYANTHYINEMKDVTTKEASLVMEAASAVRNYTSKEIVPLLRDRMKLQFLPHSVPSWSAQTQLRDVTRIYPGLTYREPAINPTNPDDLADDWETSVIKLFQAQPQLQQNVDMTEMHGGELILSRPIRLVDPECLSCHSKPANAPPQMLDLYGDKNGFDWKLGDVIAVRLVAVPTKAALDLAKNAVAASVFIVAAICFCFIILVNILLSSMVIGPLARMTNLANIVSIGTQSAAEFDGRGSANTANLADALNRMRRNMTRK